MSYYGRENRPRGTEVDTHMGVPIYFNRDSGRFEAQIGQSVVRRKEIAAVRREISKRSSRKVQVMTIYGPGSNPPTTTYVTEKTADGRWRNEAGSLLSYGVPVYVYDQAIFDELTALAEEYDRTVGEIKARHAAIRDRAVPLREMPDPEPEPEPASDGKRVFSTPRAL